MMVLFRGISLGSPRLPSCRPVSGLVGLAYWRVSMASLPLESVYKRGREVYCLILWAICAV